MQRISKRVGRVPRMVDTYSLVLVRGDLLSSEAVVLYVVDDLQIALLKEGKQDCHAKNGKSLNRVNYPQEDDLSKLHQEDFVLHHFQE